jgi:hypothetical protein
VVRGVGHSSVRDNVRVVSVVLGGLEEHSGAQEKEAYEGESSARVPRVRRY